MIDHQIIIKKLVFYMEKVKRHADC